MVLKYKSFCHKIDLARNRTRVYSVRGNDVILLYLNILGFIYYNTIKYHYSVLPMVRSFTLSAGTRLQFCLKANPETKTAVLPGTE